MGRGGLGSITLDAGALIAVERGVSSVLRLIERADLIHVPAGALAQTWRQPRRQVRLARLIDADDVLVHPLDDDAAKAAGTLCGAAGTADVIDASVVQVARSTHSTAITSNPDDLRRLAPGLPIFAI